MPINHGAAVQGAASSFRSTMSYTNGVYHLNEKSIAKLDENFKKISYTDSAANLNNFSWANANAIVLETEGEPIINDYDFSAAIGSRMGSIHEISDERNVYQLKNVFSARESYEKIYSDDKQNERSLARVSKKLNEKLAVRLDTYRLKKWADGAGTTYTVPSGATLSSSNVVRTLLTANARMDNMDVPEGGRKCFMRLTDCIEMQLADELKYQAEFTNKGAINGAITKLGKTTVIGVPDNRMPAGARAIIKWQGASADPRKLNYLRIFPVKEGHNAPILNAIWRYDSFVLAHKANGILVIGDNTEAPQAAPTAAMGTSGDAGKVILTSGSGASTYADAIYYTIDGHNPKIEDNGSAIRLGGTASSGVVKTAALTASCYIQAYAVKNGKVASGIAKYYFDYTAGTVTAVPYDENIPF